MSVNPVNPGTLQAPPIKTPMVTKDGSPHWAWTKWFQQVAINAQFVPVPPTANANGQTNQLAQDGSFLYVCVGTNQWKRVAIATW